jgi:phosphatidylglycerophosphatase A
MSKGTPSPHVRRAAESAATLFVLGKIGPAPGTLGALAGTLYYALVLQGEPSWVQGAAILLLLALGTYACDIAERSMGIKDPSCIIMDEFAVMPIVFIGLAVPESLLQRILWLAAGFAAFRFFDILKPLGISKVQKFSGGLGIMLDDVLAAIASCGVMQMAAYCLK